MKKLITLITLIFISSTFASDITNNSGHQSVQYCNMPKEIKIIQKCAKQKVKVIYKTRLVKVKPIVKIKEKIVVKIKKVTIVKIKRVYKKNMLRLLGGYGPDGVKAYYQGNVGIAEEKRGLTYGLGYSRMLNEDVSVGGDILANETYLLQAGFHF